jgi:hypothetical protein
MSLHAYYSQRFPGAPFSLGTPGGRGAVACSWFTDTTDFCQCRSFCQSGKSYLIIILHFYHPFLHHPLTFFVWYILLGATRQFTCTKKITRAWILWLPGFCFLCVFVGASASAHQKSNQYPALVWRAQSQLSERCMYSCQFLWNDPSHSEVCLQCLLSKQAKRSYKSNFNHTYLLLFTR